MEKKLISASAHEIFHSFAVVVVFSEKIVFKEGVQTEQPMAGLETMYGNVKKKLKYMSSNPRHRP